MRKAEEGRMIQYNAVNDDDFDRTNFRRISDEDFDNQSNRSTLQATEDIDKGTTYYRIDDKIETFEHTNSKKRGGRPAAFRYLACNDDEGSGTSAHAQSYREVIERQMFRLRRICVRDEDFVWTINKLRERCLNSDFDVKMVEEIMKASLAQLDQYRAITIVV